MKLRLTLCMAILVAIVCSCGTPTQIAYFQDFTPNRTHQVSNAVDIRVQSDDKISIVVNSKDPELANLFNLPIVSRYIGGTSTITGGSYQGLSGYTIDKNGDIDFPVLGKIRVAGKTRSEIAQFIKNELVSQDLIKDPIVTIEFLNLTVSVLGEVTRPGKYNIEKDNLTVLDALGMAGDLTIFGKRECVKVVREVAGEKQVYQIDLCSASNIYSSPGYYLQQNDIIYVEPNDVRARQSTVNGNNVRSASFWISLTSLLTSVASVLVMILRK